MCHKPSLKECIVGCDVLGLDYWWICCMYICTSICECRCYYPKYGAANCSGKKEHRLIQKKIISHKININRFDDLMLLSVYYICIHVTMFSGVPPHFANQPLLDSEPDGGQSIHTCVIPLGSEREVYVFASGKKSTKCYF